MPIVPELENEANIFACFLLMPSEHFTKDMESGAKVYNDEFVKDMAKKYEVPLAAVIQRMQLYNEHKK